MIRNERGFTLVEALISLVIVSTLSFISYPFIVNLYDYIRLNQVLITFQVDLHYVRDFNLMPLTDPQQMTLRIYHNEDRYVILIGNDILLERKLPSSVTIPHNNHISNISFNRQGNLGVGRVIRVVSRSMERRIVFSVGVGGFDVR
jgi:prepilin-type N-terminal cleavage/methylation domain-containing protein